MEFYCTIDKNKLTKQNNAYFCEVCKKTYSIENNIPIFIDTDFYWGEIPQEDMKRILEIIDQQGYEKGLDYLNEKHPGRSNFVFNVSRSDWRFPIDIKPGMKVLDLGCGWGSNSFPLADLGAEVYAMDSTKERVEFVRKRAEHEKYENVIPLVGDVMIAPFTNNTFDLIICNGVLEWIGLGEKYGKPDQAQKKFLDAMYELLKKDGLLYVGIENRWAAAYFYKGVDHSGLKYTSLMPRFLSNIWTKLKTKKPYLTYTYSHRGFVKLFGNSGFKDIKTYIPFPGYNNPISLVPYDSLESLRVFLLNSGRFKKIKNSFVEKIISSKPFLIIFRFFVYSFSFYLKK